MGDSRLRTEGRPLHAGSEVRQVLLSLTAAFPMRPCPSLWCYQLISLH
jgi:hypothetical protein